MYEQQLKELGLTDNEVRIYLLLLKQGMMNQGKEMPESTPVETSPLYSHFGNESEVSETETICKATK